MDRMRLTCTAMNRPELFRRLLGSLLRGGAQGWHLQVAVEPGPDQGHFAQICEALLPPGSYALRVNASRLGLRENARQLIAGQFAAGAGFVLSLEEDFELAPDALALARWYRDNHRPHWAALNLLAGACGSAGLLSWPEEPAALFESRCFNALGVGLTQVDWARLAPAWAAPSTDAALGAEGAWRHWGWDWAAFGMILHDPALRVVQPVAARCTHLGATGTHCTPAFQERAFGRLELAATAPGGPLGGYRLCPIPALPARIAAHATAQQELAAHLAGQLAGAGRRRKTPLAQRLSQLNCKLRGRA